MVSISLCDRVEYRIFNMLKTVLNSKEVKEKLLKVFPKIPLKLKPKKEILAPPITNRYGLVGTAFDYLLRFYLKRINPKASERRWVAELAAMKLTSSNKPLHKKVENIVSEAKKTYAQYLKSGKMSKKLFRASILLAQIDPILRAGFIDENLGKVDDRDIKDLKKLVSIIPQNLFKSKKLTILNPTFGKASILVGGADADLVIDNTLIEIKTTKDLKLRREWFHQIIGYYILSKIGGIGGASSKHKISKLGIYFSRYGELYTITVKTLINERKLSSLIKLFRKVAEEKLIMPNAVYNEEDGKIHFIPSS